MVVAIDSNTKVNPAKPTAPRDAKMARRRGLRSNMVAGSGGEAEGDDGEAAEEEVEDVG